MNTPRRRVQRPRNIASERFGKTSRTRQSWRHQNGFDLCTAALVAMLLLTTAPAPAQVYKVTDDKDGVTFTDRPPEVGDGTVEKIEIREPNTTPAPTPRTTSEPASITQDDEEAQPPQVSITSPGDESTIAMGPGDFTVSARVDPPLRGGERLVLMVDGQAYGTEQSSTSWFVEGAMRGPHDLVVRRIDAGGDTIATSEPVRVYVLRPSIIGR